MPLKFTYFFYFFYLGCFFNLVSMRFHSLGFNGFKRSLIFGMIPVLSFFSNLMLGRLSDLYPIRRKILCFCSIAGSIGLCLAFFLDNFYSYLFMGLVIGTIVFPMIPVNDSLTISFCSTFNKSYGHYRVWGTISFIVANVCIMFMVRFGNYSERMLLFLMPLSLIFISFSSMISKEVSSFSCVPKVRDFVSLISGKTLQLFLVTVLFHNIAFVGMFSYMSPHLKSVGMNPDLIAFCWAVSPVGEVFIFQYSHFLTRFIRDVSLLRLGLFVAILRWFILAYFDHYGLLIGSQVLHSVAFGAYYLAAIGFLSRNVPETLRSSGQGIFGASVSLAMVVGNLIMGFIFDGFGTHAVFKCSLGFSFLALFVSFFIKNDHKKTVVD